VTDAEPLPAGGAQGVLDVGATRTTLCIVGAEGCEAARTFPVGSASPVAAIAREVRASVRAWRARSAPEPVSVQRLLLTGGGPAVAGLASALATEVDGPIEPLSFTVPDGKAWAAEEAPAFALALALALRGQQGPRAGRLNLRRGELAFTRDFEHVRGKVGRLGVWAALVILLALVSSGVRVFALSRQERLLDAALCDATQKLVGKCYTNDELAVAALRGKGTAAASIPRNSAVDIFTELSVRTPADVPVRYDRIEITRDKLHLQGSTEAAENVDKIVSALRASRCFGDARSGGARKRTSDGKFEFTVDSDLTCDTGEKPGTRG
jgi:general secretion pathway protein L